MNEINIKLSTGQVALVLELLKPYAELSLMLSNQFRAQQAQASVPSPVRAEKIEKNPEVKNNG